MAYLSRWTSPLVILLGIVISYSPLLSRLIISREDHPPAAQFGFVQVNTPSGSESNNLRADGIDVIFVHGLGSNPDTTWSAPKGDSNTAESVNWVQDYLPHDIPSELRQHVRIYFYNYDSYWKRDAIESRLQDHSEKLLSRIRTQIRKSEKEQNRDLVFVGYSYGGLLIKKALTLAKIQDKYFDITKHTKGILFIGTPHRGSDYAWFGWLFARTLWFLDSHPGILEGLHYDALFLRDLHSEFISAFGTQVQIINLFEERKAVWFHIWGYRCWTGYIVRKESAIFDGSQVENYGYARDHFALNKYAARNTEYNDTCNHLLKLILKPYQNRLINRRNISTITLKTVPNYTQRNSLSTSLEEELRKVYPSRDLAHALAIQGLGGAGKTQLVLNYVESHGERYNPIFWISAEDEYTVQSTFEYASRELRLPQIGGHRPNTTIRYSPVIQSVLKWLKERDDSDPEWLVIIDNADDLSWDIRGIIPQGQRGSVIVTSRDSRSHHLFAVPSQVLHVDKMEPMEASSLLLGRLGPEAISVAKETQDIADEITETLDYFAFAVDLAGAYILQTGSSTAVLKQYSRDLKAHRDELFKDQSLIGLKDYDKNIMTVWETTFRAIEKRNPISIYLLSFLALLHRRYIEDILFDFASHGFSEHIDSLRCERKDFPDWLNDLFAVTKGEWDKFGYLNALKPLLDYNLVQRVDCEGVSLHSLVKWRARQFELEKPWDLWCVCFFEAVSMHKGYFSMPFFLLRHLASFLASSETSWTFLHNTTIRRYLGQEVLFSFLSNEVLEEATELGARHFKLQQSLMGTKPSDESYLTNISASMYLRQGLFTDIEQTVRYIVDASPENSYHPLDRIDYIHILARIYNMQGRCDEAKELLINAKASVQRTVGYDYDKMWALNRTLATTFRCQGEFQKAENLLVKAIEAVPVESDSFSQPGIELMNELKLTYEEQSKWEDAVNLGIIILKILFVHNSVEHPQMFAMMSSLARTYKIQKKWPEAEELFLLTSPMMYNAWAAAIQHDRLNLGLIYLDQERWEEAQNIFVKVIKVRQRNIGSWYPETSIAAGYLGMMLWYQGRRKQAQDTFTEVMKIESKLFGKHHPWTLNSLRTLTAISRHQTEKEAKPFMRIKVIDCFISFTVEYSNTSMDKDVPTKAGEVRMLPKNGEDFLFNGYSGLIIERLNRSIYENGSNQASEINLSFQNGVLKVGVKGCCDSLIVKRPHAAMDNEDDKASAMQALQQKTREFRERIINASTDEAMMSGMIDAVTHNCQDPAWCSRVRALKKHDKQTSSRDKMLEFFGSAKNFAELIFRPRH